ncbi:WecB/TagA/CpsF family glycosyltransferase [uncultured Chloroflexus sp.]|uniref:WecB/TagA/CpsF family glycosyltransferase n=1 Tax=uncultured Chloroflexus sp. TaxID=214040 RepID=UPI00260D1C31|nr:WecB/TagA/CpsF family glycosyltransferase [uncultured Chloroflexus sp.]
MRSGRIDILGIPIDDVTEPEVVARAAAMIEAGGPHQICTVNPEFIMEARRHPAFRAVLQASDLNTPDGFGVLLAARWLGTPLRGRVTGVELTQRLAQLAAERGYRIFLLGAGPGVAEAAAAVLLQRWPGLQIAGCYAGSPAPEADEQQRKIIAAARPDILLVAYGHPRQELWIARNQPFVQVPLAMGVGGTFDYLAGRVPRAPQVIRRLGLEWAFRLAVQPARWRRIIDAVPAFALAVLWQGRRGRESGMGSDGAEK